MVLKLLQHSKWLLDRVIDCVGCSLRQRSMWCHLLSIGLSWTSLQARAPDRSLPIESAPDPSPVAPF